MKNYIKIIIIMFSILVIVLLINGYLSYNQGFGIFSSSDTLIPALWLKGDLILVEGASEYISVPLMLTKLPYLEVWLSNLLNINLLAIERSLAVSGILFSLLGFVIAGYAIKRNLLVGILAATIYPISWVSNLLFGYSYNMVSAPGNTGTWAMAVSVFIWAIWLLIDRSGYQRIIPYAMTGILFNFHPTYAVILIVVFISLDIYRAFTTPGSRFFKKIKHTYWNIGIFIILGLPQFISIIRTFGLARNASAHDWWKIMFFRKMHHLLPWRNPEYLLGFIVIVAIYLLLLKMIKPSITHDKYNKLLISFVVVNLFVLLNILGVEIFWNPLIASLTLTRASFLIAVLIILIISQYSFDQLELLKEKTVANNNDLITGFLLPVLFLSSVQWYISGIIVLVFLVLHYVLKKFNKSIPPWIVVLLGVTYLLSVFVLWGHYYRIVFFALIIIYLLIVIYLLNKFTVIKNTINMLKTKKYFYIKCFLIVISLFIITIGHLFNLNGIQQLVRSPGGDTASIENWRDLTDWMRTETSRESLFLMPPYPVYSTAISHRSSIIDAGSLGNSVYVSTLTEFEIKALRVIYDIDLSSKSQSEIINIGSDYHNVMERAYDKALNNERIIEIKKEYPKLSYVVGLQPGGVYPRRDTGPFEGSILDFPIAFSNDMYVVYFVEDL